VGLLGLLVAAVVSLARDLVCQGFVGVLELQFYVFVSIRQIEKIVDAIA
jgi:hypothetical protein